MQNVVAVFDDSLVRVATPRVSTFDRCLSLYEYVKDGKYPLFVFWDHGMIGTKKTSKMIDDGTGTMRSSLFFDSAKIYNLGYEKDADDFLKPKMEPRMGIPSDDFTTRPNVFAWEGAPMKEPVWVDLFTGAVYEIPAKQQIVHSCGVSLVRIPVYDSPCVVTERAAIDMM